MRKSVTEHDHPLDGAQLVVLAVLGWPCHTCIPKGFVYDRDHFISTFLSLIESYLALFYVLPYSLTLLYYKITKRKNSMSAAQIPEKFTV